MPNFWIDHCEKHGYYYSSTLPCPGCSGAVAPVEWNSSNQIKEMDCNLGRLEDNAQEDREFLQACGITAD